MKKIICILIMATFCLYGVAQNEVNSDQASQSKKNRLFNIKVGYLAEQNGRTLSNFHLNDKSFFVGLEHRYKFRAKKLQFIQSYNLGYRGNEGLQVALASTEFITRYTSAFFHADFGVGAGFFSHRENPDMPTYVFDNEFRYNEKRYNGFTINTYLGIGMDFKHWSPFIHWNVTDYIPSDYVETYENSQLRVGVIFKF